MLNLNEKNCIIKKFKMSSYLDKELIESFKILKTLSISALLKSTLTDIRILGSGLCISSFK